ncbi:hypothetical protein [Pyxidicoccus fallax]|uniref:hypothetical protein n=1 Tax=Pyxidicoccus fallax TaxID=394095 RepID=UPI0020A6C775|nr:hypothetical protein [Pyxidicoccus fallax]
MMKSFVTVFHRSAQRAAGLLLAMLAVGCGDSRDDFIGPRVKDACDAAWPVCNRVAGCILGSESYAEGRFPGRGQFIVQIPEASTVKVSFYLEEVSAAGQETVVLFHEEGCRARTRQAADGRAVLDQMEEFGEFTREADVTGVGDHLIEFESDMQAKYVVKVDVTPLRVR